MQLLSEEEKQIDVLLNQKREELEQKYEEVRSLERARQALFEERFNARMLVMPEILRGHRYTVSVCNSYLTFEPQSSDIKDVLRATPWDMARRYEMRLSEDAAPIYFHLSNGTLSVLVDDGEALIRHVGKENCEMAEEDKQALAELSWLSAVLSEES